MNTTPEALRDLVLFEGLSGDDLARVLAVFETRRFKKGDVLFEEGSSPEHLHLLVAGAVSVMSGEDEVLLAKPPTPLGELSALTDDLRVLTAVCQEDCEVLMAPLPALQEILETSGPGGFRLQKNLLKLASRKIGRDRRRAREMRQNIVNTQKAMKAMRDALLESEDNPLHASLFEELDALIENNRRVHYLVEPSRLVPTQLRLNGGVTRRVTAISNEWLYFENPPEKLEQDAEFSAVLLLDGQEIPVSGSVDRYGEKEAVIFLDELVASYADSLDRHLTRAQMLDVVL